LFEGHSFQGRGNLSRKGDDERSVAGKRSGGLLRRFSSSAPTVQKGSVCG
jgi:hypothetical protein